MEKGKIISEDLLRRYCKGMCNNQEVIWLEDEMKRLPHLKLRVQQINLKIAKDIELSSFKDFFDFYYPKLMAHACRFVNEETAKDVVQEVFVTYWEKKETIEANNIQSYMYRWVQNSCLNVLKHKGIASDVHTRIAEKRIEAFELYADSNDSIRNLYTKDVYEMIESSLQKLPPRTAEACRLFLFQDLAQKEIGKKMEISVRTVETHIHKAFVFLRKDLQDVAFLLFLVFFNK